MDDELRNDDIGMSKSKPLDIIHRESSQNQKRPCAVSFQNNAGASNHAI
ncbi:MAG: hypothetical protein ACI4DO_10780 [Roseburia sp.]